MITYKLLTNKGERGINEDSIGVARNKDLYCFILAVPGDITLSILGAVLVKRVKPLIGLEAITMKSRA